MPATLASRGLSPLSGQPSRSPPTVSHMDGTEFWAGVVRYLVRYGGPFVPAVFERAKGSYVYDSAGHGQPMRMTEYVSRA